MRKVGGSLEDVRLAGSRAGDGEWNGIILRRENAQAKTGLNEKIAQVGGICGIGEEGRDMEDFLHGAKR